MSKIVMVRPGATDFDEQGRIIGTLDLPLSATGTGQASRVASEIALLGIRWLYTSPCQSAQQTANLIGGQLGVKVKELAKLANLNHGLWHGKLIAEVKQRQPKVYRQWQDNPASVCPPEGEGVEAVQDRVEAVFAKLLKKHKSEMIGVVCPEPLASVAIGWLCNIPLGDIWQAECRCGSWEIVEVERGDVAALG